MKLAVFVIPWILSGITLWSMFMAGNMHSKAWLVGLSNQLLWLVWIIISKNWGLIPMNIGMWCMCYCNHQKWNKKQKTT